MTDTHIDPLRDLIGIFSNQLGTNAESTLSNAIFATLFGNGLTVSTDGIGRVVLTPIVINRFKPASTQSYFVRQDGNDANDGKTNSIAGAFATVQKAIDTVADLDITAGQSATITVAAGTYAETLLLKNFTGGGQAIIFCSATTIFEPGGGVTLQTNRLRSNWTISSGVWQNSGGDVIVADIGSRHLKLDGVKFGASSGVHLNVQDGAIVSITTSYTIAGGAVNHWKATGTGKIIAVGTATLTGTPAFTAFARADDLGYIRCPGMTFTGSATGQRYNINTNGVIQTSGGGASYLPGNSAGATATGGQYA
jgi:hypothetical protein